ncbi:MAG: hypothetical protein ACREU7_16395, partial [Burkholderiales bacterium]
MKPNSAIWFMVVANAIAAAGLLAAWPWQTGARGMLFFITGVVHLVLAAGLWRMRNWARILMICYAAFQFAALSIAAMTALALVMADGFTAAAGNRLLLAALGLPLLSQDLAKPEFWESRY